VVGGAFYDTTPYFAVVRLQPGGRLDLGFGTNGVARAPLFIDDPAGAVELQGDGRIVAVSAASADFEIARFLP
jgi:hypothetical protein